MDGNPILSENCVLVYIHLNLVDEAFILDVLPPCLPAELTTSVQW